MGRTKEAIAEGLSIATAAARLAVRNRILVDTIARGGHFDGEVFAELARETLRSLADDVHAPELVLDAYLLRALAVAGWAPSFHDCARCGADGPHRAFNLAAGGTVCPVCRPPGSAAPAPETLALLAALLAGDWAVADASDGVSPEEQAVIDKVRAALA